MKHRFHERLQISLDHGLRDAIVGIPNGLCTIKHCRHRSSDAHVLGAQCMEIKRTHKPKRNAGRAYGRGYAREEAGRSELNAASRQLAEHQRRLGRGETYRFAAKSACTVSGACPASARLSKFLASSTTTKFTTFPSPVSVKSSALALGTGMRKKSQQVATVIRRRKSGKDWRA